MKFIGERILNVYDEEDSGQARIAHFELDEEPPPYTNEDNGLYVRLQSWDDSKAHLDWESLRGRRVRITIETID